MKAPSKDHQVREVAGRGFIAVWRGREVHSTNGAVHMFPTEKDARQFLRLCDAVDGMPAISAGTPAPKRQHP